MELKVASQQRQPPFSFQSLLSIHENIEAMFCGRKKKPCNFIGLDDATHPHSPDEVFLTRHYH